MPPKKSPAIARSPYYMFLSILLQALCRFPILSLFVEGTEGVEVKPEPELPSYPEGGYWSLDPAVRLRMLHALMHDALETNPVR